MGWRSTGGALKVGFQRCILVVLQGLSVCSKYMVSFFLFLFLCLVVDGSLSSLRDYYPMAFVKRFGGEIS